jgi:lysine 6-dehydrogenase
MVRYATKKFDKIHTVEVGFSWDSNMKVFVVPFSIQSIIEEFTDPAPIVERCKFVTKTPLSSIKWDHHRFIGQQKCFFVRHPETYTFYRYLKNKGIKNVRFYAGFPQHSFEKILALIELGFGSKKPIMFKGMKTRPIDFTTEALKALKMPRGYQEIEVLWARFYGLKNKRKKALSMDCLVHTLPGWENAGCNIDTGMPASIIAQMIKKDIITERGSFAPEDVVPPELFFKELKKRHMFVYENKMQIN